MTKNATFNCGDLAVGDRELSNFYAIKLFSDSDAFWNPIATGNTDFNLRQYQTKEAAEKAMKTPTYREFVKKCESHNRLVQPEIVHVVVSVSVSTTV